MIQTRPDPRPAVECWSSLNPLRDFRQPGRGRQSYKAREKPFPRTWNSISREWNRTSRAGNQLLARGIQFHAQRNPISRAQSNSSRRQSNFFARGIQFHSCTIQFDRAQFNFTRMKFDPFHPADHQTCILSLGLSAGEKLCGFSHLGNKVALSSSRNPRADGKRLIRSCDWCLPRRRVNGSFIMPIYGRTKPEKIAFFNAKITPWTG